MEVLQGGGLSPDEAAHEVPDPHHWGLARTPWGVVLMVWHGRSILRCSFCDEPIDVGSPAKAMGSTFEDHPGAQGWIDRWLDSRGTLGGAGQGTHVESPLLEPEGTRFQRRVWLAMTGIPSGSVLSYGRLAQALGAPRAARAVGAACGANPVALWIPCHRVVRSDGGSHGYRWGEARKAALLAWEAGRSPDPRESFRTPG